jgi:hypothetical protein
MFQASSPIIAVAAAGTTNFILVNGANELHFQYEFEADKRCDLVLYENPTITVNGTAMAPVNTNRNSAATTAVTAFYGSTIAVNGDQRETHIVGDAAGGGSVGGQVRAFGEWEGAPSVDWLIAVVSAAVNTDMALKWRFYET